MSLVLNLEVHQKKETKGATLLKQIKYAKIKAAYEFVLVAVGTLGPINNKGHGFFYRSWKSPNMCRTRDQRESKFTN